MIKIPLLILSISIFASAAIFDMGKENNPDVKTK